jgi:ubiquinol-cytochrome c reductase cytochrome b subunit
MTLRFYHYSITFITNITVPLPYYSLNFIHSHLDPVHFNHSKSDDVSFNEWLAGVIDGDGYFHILASKYPSLTIEMEKKNLPLLLYICQKIGGLIYTNLKGRPNVVRLTIRKRSNMIDLVNRINGNIRNSIRVVQFTKVCEILHISYISAAPLIYENAWMSGFFDADGTIIASFSKPFGIRIHITNKYSDDLEHLESVYGGKTYAVREKNGDTYAHRWIVSSRAAILSLSAYFKLYPPRSHKFCRVTMIESYYHLQDRIISTDGSVHYNDWLVLEERWKNEF